jgi:hypothetical protein
MLALRASELNRLKQVGKFGMLIGGVSLSLQGPELVLDDEGAELPDIAAAREEALASAREVLANLLRTPEKRPPQWLCRWARVGNS